MTAQPQPRFWTRAVAFVTRFRWAALAVAVAVSGLCVGGAPSLSASVDPTAYIPKDRPEVKTWLDLTNRFDGLSTLMIGLEEPGQPFTFDGLARLGYPIVFVRPGRDPRQDAPPPILRSDVLKMEDLAPGMRLKGTVRNVVDFGAFIDIGVKQDGLLHRTRMPTGTVLKVGDIIDVEIVKIEPERGRIGLGLVLHAN